MKDTFEILRLRVLLCFWQWDAGSCTVTDVARTLGEQKYTISRVLSALEKEGLMDRNNPRQPTLTSCGRLQAEKYSERVETSLNHLLYEGVSLENARQDALYWALYCTDQTIEVIRTTAARDRIKYELRNQQNFSGAALCKRIGDGSYSFPFLIYRNHAKNGNILSMGNEGFEHPCTLYVKNHTGTIQLRCRELWANSAVHGKRLRGRVKSLKYFDHGVFGCAEMCGDLLQFPADVLNFVSMGDGAGQILHGSVCVKLQGNVGAVHMPESKAIFTIMI